MLTQFIWVNWTFQIQSLLPHLDSHVTLFLVHKEGAEHEVGCMVQWAPCPRFIHRRGDQTRLCNFERFLSVTLHWYGIPHPGMKKVKKFGKDNSGMYRMNKKRVGKEEGRARSSLIWGSGKPQYFLPGGLSNRISHTGSVDLIALAQTTNWLLINRLIYCWCLIDSLSESSQQFSISWRNSILQSIFSSKKGKFNGLIQFYSEPSCSPGNATQ